MSKSVTESEQTYDLLIVGGGLVGASLAVALHGRGLRIALVESQPFGSAGQASFDDRAIALAAGSQRIFAGMGLWPEVAEQATPIRRIHVSDRGRFGLTRLDHREEGVPALGYVVLSRSLGQVLAAQVQHLEEVSILSPAEVTAVHTAGELACLTIERDGREQTLASRLIVAADGARSRVRELMGIATTEWQYGQTAVIANVGTSRPHGGVAYERFTADGPMAMLPMSQGRSALVWTQPTERTGSIMALDDAAFVARLQDQFGYRLGRFTRVGRRDAYPLSLVRARQSVAPRLALIGNAAHTLHPIAGQGFNLGLRDVAALAEVLDDAVRRGEDIGAAAVLERYADWRQADHRRVIAFTDGLTRLFTNPLAPVAWVRNLGMLALDVCPPAKRLFGRLTMGRGGRLPRLARGLPL